MGTLGWSGDSLAVGLMHTWALFTATGEYAKCRNSRVSRNHYAAGVRPVHPLPGGLTLGDMETPERGQALVVSSGEQVQHLLAKRAFPKQVGFGVRGVNATFYVVTPFVVDVLWSAADNGQGVVVASAARFPGPGPQPVRVRRTRVDGTVTYETQVRVPAVAVRKQDRAAAVESWLASQSHRTAEERARMRAAYLRHVPLPQWLPPVVRVLAGADGSAWLRRPGAGETAEWIDLDASGREQARLRFPAAFNAMWAGGGRLWGTLLDPVAGLQVVSYAVGTQAPLPDYPRTAPPPYVGQMWMSFDCD